jgi:TatD DNase family protein
MIASKLTQESIVLETDAPDIPPANHRGESNLPEYLPEIQHTLAALRHETPEVVGNYTTANAGRILGLPTGAI